MSLRPVTAGSPEANELIDNLQTIVGQMTHVFVVNLDEFPDDRRERFHKVLKRIMLLAADGSPELLLTALASAESDRSLFAVARGVVYRMEDEGAFHIGDVLNLAERLWPEPQP